MMSKNNIKLVLTMMFAGLIVGCGDKDYSSVVDDIKTNVLVDKNCNKKIILLLKDEPKYQEFLSKLTPNFFGGYQIKNEKDIKNENLTKNLKDLNDAISSFNVNCSNEDFVAEEKKENEFKQKRAKQEEKDKKANAWVAEDEAQRDEMYKAPNPLNGGETLSVTGVVLPFVSEHTCANMQSSILWDKSFSAERIETFKQRCIELDYEVNNCRDLLSCE